MNKIYIDGQAGTTGLQIHSRLSGRDDIEILEIDADYRKDLMARRELINASDITILCLPDLAAKEAVSLVDSESVRILDASSAHRITDQWVYGLPEMSQAQKSAIKNARWVSNPGCLYLVVVSSSKQKYIMKTFFFVAMLLTFIYPDKTT